VFLHLALLFDAPVIDVDGAFGDLEHECGRAQALEALLRDAQRLLDDRRGVVHFLLSLRAAARRCSQGSRGNW
jgi:hypothetical protein